MKHINRREALTGLAALFLFLLDRKAFAQKWITESASPGENLSKSNAKGQSHFKNIYGDPQLKAAFFQFLQSVYHLYPEEKFHTLIELCSKNLDSDREIYLAIQKRLPEIKPFLQSLSYALPALDIQKREMTRQTVELLSSKHTYSGYVEIGTPGRYISNLQKHIKLEGPIYHVHTHQPSFSPEDILERGQIGRVGIGKFVPMNNYSALALPETSVDLISNYIGLHHCPRENLDGFVQSIWKTLKPSGKFILRDHDVTSPEMDSLVALAHDVFNCGLGLPWEDNSKELRYFKSVSYIEDYLNQHGFKRTGPFLAQSGDPTHNLLMVFEKVNSI